MFFSWIAAGFLFVSGVKLTPIDWQLPVTSVAEANWKNSSVGTFPPPLKFWARHRGFHLNSGVVPGNVWELKKCNNCNRNVFGDRRNVRLFFKRERCTNGTEPTAPTATSIGLTRVEDPKDIRLFVFLSQCRETREGRDNHRTWLFCKKFNLRLYTPFFSHFHFGWLFLTFFPAAKQHKFLKCFLNVTHVYTSVSCRFFLPCLPTYSTVT